MRGAKLRRKLRKASEPLVVLLVLVLIYIAFIEAKQTDGQRPQRSAQEAYDAMYFLFVALLIGAVCKSLLRASSVPYTVVLLLVGVLLGALNFYADLGDLGHSMDVWSNLSSDLVLAIFLPALVFHSSYTLDTHTFSKAVSQALILAGPGVLIGASLIALIARYVFPYSWSWPLSFTFGSLLTATDPVAVVALMEEAGGPGWLTTVVEGESMLNDGTAIVLFEFFKQLVEGQSFTGGGVIAFFLRRITIGPLIGWATAEVIYLWLSFTRNDIMVDISITVFASYLVFLVSQFQADSSGVLAVLTLGACLSQRTKAIMACNIEHNLEAVWSLLTYVANTLVFLLAGDIIARKLLENRDKLSSNDLLYGIMLYLFVMLIRFGTNTVLFPALRRTGYGIDWSSFCVMSWGGLRGAVSLALALALDESAGENKGVSEKQGSLIVLHTGVVVILTLVLNATTVRWLLIRLGIVKQTSDSKRAVIAARSEVRDAVLSEYREKFQVDDTLGSPDFTTLSGYVTVLQHSNIETQYGEDTGAGEQDSNGKPKDTSIEDQLVDARLRWLEGLKTIYWERLGRDNVQAPPSVIHALVEATNVAIDAARNQEPLSDWAAVLREFRYSRRVNATPRISGKILLAITRLLPAQTLWRRGSMRLFLLAAKHFVTAHKEVQEATEKANLLGDKGKLYDTVFEESAASIAKAQAALREARINYPEATRAVKIEDVAYQLLSAEAKRVDELARSGLIDSVEHTIVMESHDNSLRHLRAKPPVPKQHSSDSILRSMKLFDSAQGGLSGDLLETVLQQILSAPRPARYLQPGDTLVQAGQPVKTAWLLGRGVVRMKGSGRDWRRIGTVSHPYGWVVGASQALYANEPQHYLSVEAVSDVTAFAVSPEILHQIKQEAPQATLLLIRTTAGLLVETKLQPELPSLRTSVVRSAINSGNVEELNTGDMLTPAVDLDGSELVVLVEGCMMSHQWGTYSAPAALAPLRDATGLPDWATSSSVARKRTSRNASGQSLASSEERLTALGGNERERADFYAVQPSVVVRGSLNKRGLANSPSLQADQPQGARGPEAV